jgi:hypothetical protein
MSSNPEVCQVLDLPPLAEIIECLTRTRRHQPATITFAVEVTFLGEDSPTHKLMKFVPALLRVTYVPDCEAPQYELEGWMVWDEPRRVWARLRLITSDSGEFSEGDIRRLAPGEELGTVPSDWS